MSQDNRVKGLMAAFQKTAYFRWMAHQGVPVIDGYGIEDVREVALDYWPRLGGRAAFINLYGMEGVTGMYVAEIPSGGALAPEKNFYEEVICILSGQGATEVWQEGGRTQMFEWGAMEPIRAAAKYLASSDQRRAAAGKAFGRHQRSSSDGHFSQ
jgi:hypothetical protein